MPRPCRVTLVLAVALVAAVFFMARAERASPAGGQPPERIEVKSKDGKHTVTISAGNDGASLLVTDANGRPVTLVMGEDGKTSVQLVDRLGRVRRLLLDDLEKFAK